MADPAGPTARDLYADAAGAEDTEGSAFQALTDGTRVVLALVVSLIVALSLEAWMRVILLWRGRDEVGRIRTVNGLFQVWGRASFWVGRAILGLRVQVEGRVPDTGRYFIVSNHQSSIDVPMLISIFRGQNLKFVAMEELRYWKPAVSLALRVGGCAFVAKQSLGADLRALRRFGQELHRFDGSAVIFPEGKRTFDGSILPFTFAGTEAVRATARLPMLPVTIDGLWKARTLRGYRHIVGNRVTVRISEPVPFEETPRAPRETYRRIEQEIRRNMDEIRRRDARDQVPRGPR